jgi:phosphoglycolate phosphatase-like HAD superfamily hydrolase
MSIKAIIFDFDGVILPDSQHAKDTAYLKLFPKEEAHISAILPEISHRYGGGRGDRRDIIRDLFSMIHGRAPAHDEFEVLVQRFSKSITEEIDQMVPPPSTIHALERFSQRYPLYLASATPHDELIRRIAQIGLSSYFKNVFGRPTTKDEVVHEVVSAEGVIPEEIVLVGDAQGDFETAKRMRTRFVAVKNKWNSWDAEIAFPTLDVEDLQSLDRHME